MYAHNLLIHNKNTSQSYTQDVCETCTNIRNRTNQSTKSTVSDCIEQQTIKAVLNFRSLTQTLLLNIL